MFPFTVPVSLVSALLAKRLDDAFVTGDISGGSNFSRAKDGKATKELPNVNILEH